MVHKPFGRVAHNLTVGVMVLCFGLASVFVQGVYAESGEVSFSHQSYVPADPFSGDLGGYYGGGAQSIHADVGVNFGGGLKLGCEGINVMDYMKSKFNVSEMSEKLKGMMKTMLAKQVLTFMMSIPQIAAAYDFLNADLNAGFDMFQQSCDIGEIREKGKQLYIDRECSKKTDTAEYRQCVEGYDVMKPMREAFTKNFGKQLCAFNQQPVQTMRPTLCGGPNNSSACILMSYLPEVCIESAMCGKSCVGGNVTQPPISMVGISDAMMQYSDLVKHESQNVWDQIRRIDPNMEPATIEAIGQAASKMFAQDTTCGGGPVTSQKGQVRDNSLAFTKLSFLTTKFGAASPQDSMLDKYRQTEKMATCKNKPELYNPLLMLKCVANAANAELQKQGFNANIDVNITVAENEKVDAGQFFNLPAPGTPAAQRLGIDSETGTKMLEDTFGCLVNTEILMTSPNVQAKLALGGGMSWRDYHRAIGQRVSCAAVDYIGNFLLEAVADAKPRLNGSDVAKDLKVSTKDANGNDQVQSLGDVPADAIKGPATDVLEQIEKGIKGRLAINKDMCVRKHDVTEVLKDMFTPRQGYGGDGRLFYMERGYY